MAARLITLFQIRPGESRLVAWLVAVMFAPSAGGAIGSPAVEALFLTRVGVEFYPIMFMAVGVLTILTSVIVTALLGRVSRKRLYLALPPTLALILVIARILVGLELGWFYPLLWLAMSLLWVFQGLLGWGLAGMVCDTRQAKRLFPLFGAGSILGITVGGLLTQPLVQVLGAENLLLVWATTLLLAQVPVRALTGRVDERRARPRRRPRLAETLQHGYQYVRRSELLRWLSLAVLSFSVLMYALQFPFARAVAAQFPEANDLAGFFGLFGGLTTGAAFLATLLVANRFFARFGFMSAILALPLIYVLGFAALIAYAAFPAFVVFRFLQMAWMLGMADTAYQAVFNIVPTERREPTRVFIDGLPRQVGIVLGGLLLVVGERFLQPEHMFVIGVAVAALAVLIVWQARRAYGSALVAALRAGQSSVFFSEEEPFGGLQQDSSAVAAAVAGVADTDPAVRRVSAEILGNLAVPAATQAMVAALDDSDVEVRKALLRSLARANATLALLEVAHCLTDPEPEVRQQAVESLRHLAGYPRGLSAMIEPLLDDPAPAVRSSVAVALLQNGRHPRAVEMLQAMARAEESESCLVALNALAEWGDPAGYDPAAAGLDSAYPAVRRAAAVAVVKIDPHRCLEPLVQALADEDTSVRQAVAEAMAQIVPPPLQRLVAALDRPETEDGALRALGRLPADQVAGELRAYARGRAAEALRHRDLWLSLPVDGDENGDLSLLATSLQDVARNNAKNALRAICLVSDRGGMALAIDNLSSGDTNQRANALEMLDALGDTEIVRPLLRVWETDAAAPAGHTSPSLREVLVQLMQDGNAWLRACAALATRSLDGSDADTHVRQELARLAERDPDPAVQEAAAIALKGDPQMDTLATLSLMERILFLRRVPLFADLPPAELKQVAAIAYEQFFVDGEAIAQQGEPGDEMYIVVSGEVRVVASHDRKADVELARVQAGDVVGEMAIISHEPRMASLVASGDVRVLCIDQKRFEGILRDRPETSLAVMRVLIDRLRRSQETVGD